MVRLRTYDSAAVESTDTRTMRTYVRDRAAARARPLPPSDRAPSTLDGRGRGSRAAEPAAQDALQLVHLYFERGSPKAEPAARRWLVRYLSEGSPSLRDIAKVTASLAEASSRRADRGEIDPIASYRASRGLDTLPSDGGGNSPLSLRPIREIPTEASRATASPGGVRLYARSSLLPATPPY